MQISLLAVIGQYINGSTTRDTEILLYYLTYYTNEYCNLLVFWLFPLD